MNTSIYKNIIEEIELLEGSIDSHDPSWKRTEQDNEEFNAMCDRVVELKDELDIYKNWSKEGLFNDSVASKTEIEFNKYLQNKYSYDFNMFIRSRDKEVSKLTLEEAVNEHNAYYQIYKKFINMPFFAVDRVAQIKSNISNLKGE